MKTVLQQLTTKIEIMKYGRLILVFILSIFLLTSGTEIQAQSKGNLKYFSERREKVLEQINDGIAIISSTNEKQRAAEFYYLTGYHETGAYLVLNSEENNEYILFVKQENIDEVKSLTDADKIYSIDNLGTVLEKLNPGNNKFYLRAPDLKTRTMLKLIFGEFEDNFNISNINPITDEMRVIKDKLEIDYLEKAIDITCDAHINAFKFTSTGKNESGVQNTIETTFLNGGGQGPGFTTICGSGPRTAILHYSENSEIMQNGDMLVMDIGCSYKNYTADVTRTIPVNGKFTKEQAEIYELVLKSQKAAIELMKPGRGVHEGQNKVNEVIKDGLVELGLITDPESDWQAGFYIRHGYTHWIGLVVHDVGSYRGRENGKSRTLEPGMIMTIEPGIYISEDMLDALDGKGRRLRNVPDIELKEFKKKVKPLLEKYMNIGVRIEDDILITEHGNRIVSINAPKEIKDIEAIMN